VSSVADPQPTLRFAKSQKVVITEGEEVKAPLRLTGQAVSETSHRATKIQAWEIVYSLNGKDMSPINIRDRNQELTFNQKGIYRLTKVC
jgi:nucleoporin POM152